LNDQCRTGRKRVPDRHQSLGGGTRCRSHKASQIPWRLELHDIAQSIECHWIHKIGKVILRQCLHEKKQEHLPPDDLRTLGDTWIWKAMAVPSHLRVVNPLSHERSEPEAPTFLAAFKARTDGRPPLLTRDKLPASIAARMANDR